MAKKNKDPDERHRMLASLSFVAVLIVIGIPLWWKTTEVYRVSLPYDDIEALRHAQVKIAVKITVLGNDEPTTSEVAGLLRQRFSDEEVLQPKIEQAVLQEDLRTALSSASGEREAESLLAKKFDLKTPGHVFVVQRNRLNNAVWLGEERVVLFKDAAAGSVVASVLRDWVFRARALGPHSPDARAPPPAPAYDVVLTVAHPALAQYTLEFDAEGALNDYIGSFVDELSSLANFTLRSQWVHLLEVDFKPEKDALGRFIVRSAQLPHVISPLEERAGARASPRPALRLVLYAVPCHASPMYIADDSGEIVSGPISGLASARWGGVVVASPDDAACAGARAFAPSVPQVMGIFVAQLRELLGIEKLSPIEGAVVTPLRSVRPRAWELDALSAVRTVQQLTSAALTLSSISQLLDEIPNIVINDEVGACIRDAASSAQAALRAAAAGDLPRAHERSRAAAAAAEDAFTAPSLLALLYFPNDQKYAVYIPLFLPVMIPVLISLKNIAAWLRGKPKDKTD